MNIDFLDAPVSSPAERSAVALLAYTGRSLSTEAQAVDRHLHHLLTAQMQESRFEGAAGDVLEVSSLDDGRLRRWILIGAGDASKIAAIEIEHAAARAYTAAEAAGVQHLYLQFPFSTAATAAHAAFGVRLAAYRFHRHKSQLKSRQQPAVTHVTVQVADADAARAEFERLAAVADGVYFARDLTSEPANELGPQEFAARVRELAEFGLNIEVLGVAEMTRLGMGALLGVGQGSTRESQLAILQWNGGAKDQPPIAFVGKGVCFDTGGISIKGWEHMEDMIWDMGGAAAIAGAMLALAKRKAKVNAVGVLGLVENMPDGNAQRPGDVVKTMSGQTIEIISTDAEGRLVLADALWYTQQRFAPAVIVDVATLTGATEVALGKLYAGIYCNRDALAHALIEASVQEGEPLWRLPLIAEYAEQIDSAVADMKNYGGRPAGGITAALLLERFVNGKPWAHLDIAGVAWKKPSRIPTIPEGATGFGVRLLHRFVSEHYEAR